MNYHNITYPDQNNGPGLRVVIWVSGCSHHCLECQNPQTWDENSGILFDNPAKEEVIKQLKNKYISGVTWSGGDPMHEDNVETVLEFTEKIHDLFPEKNIWLYTGYTFEEIMNDANLKRKQLLDLCDVLVDGEYKKELRDISLHWCGSSNQRIIDVKNTLKENKIILYED